MRDSDIEVEETIYGVLIRDVNTLEGVAVEKKNIKKLIQDLQEHLEWDFNEVATPIARDEFLIPLGEHQATCGCKLKGRSLISPCETHRKALGLADLSKFSMPEVSNGSGALPPPAESGGRA